MDETQFSKDPEFRIWNFFNVFRVLKCRLSPLFGIIKSKVIHSEISFIVTKLSLSWLKCSTMEPCQEIVEDYRQRFGNQGPTCIKFQQVFNKTYYLAWVKKQKIYEFIELVQGTKTMV